ncbi:MAG: gliding motility-associated C-terminal domain-containing protein [Crocinitomicaceae bacterium]|nr:gliding motility-associated C-terminal domain-containing protein [Crocinitomicaceae bacterium]
MKVNTPLISAFFCFSSLFSVHSQCEITATANPTQIYCGQSTTLTAYGIGSGTVVMNESFNSGFGPGWSGTPGATSFSNPCSPGGVDGTPHAWMDANTSVPRTLTSAPFNISSATAGVTICFDLLFATQGGNAPCEGPDEPNEGVYFQYSTNGGTTWTTIHYFDPDGGYNTPYTSWNNWCFQIPAAAITSNTMFRWHQTADSGAQYDHWGIDNVQIVQNDVNAEVVWGHDGYSYGTGNSGGANPTPVSPTTTTTYPVTITTGTGQTCTTNVTVIVLDPVYGVDVTANPTTICVGDCADITGTAVQVLDPGGIETYENNEFELVVSTSTSVNINVQGINSSSIYDGLIQNVTINGFNFSGTFICTSFTGCNCNGSQIGIGQTCNINTSGFTVTLTSPGGCQIVLAPANSATGNYNSTVFVPVGGTGIGGGFPAGGPWAPNQPFSNLNGCDPNGVWTLTFSSPGFGIGGGMLTGWSITFDDPPIHAPVTTTWAPTTGLSNPNDINTQACPTNSTNYVLTVANSNPGCPTHTETIAITVDPCGGCIPPAVTINPLTACAPATLNLANAIDPASQPATLSYHASQADAQNDGPTISTTVTTSGTYWVRIEDPNDPTCFTTQQITVNISTAADASFTFNDFCFGTTNGPTGIATSGGTFTFSPAPTDGATINASTGVISNGVAGTTYSVQYTVGTGSCAASHTESVTVLINPTPIINGNVSYCNSTGVILDAGTGYTNYSWSTGETTQTITATAQTGLTVTVTNANGCTATSPAVTITAGNVTLQTVNTTAPDCNQNNGSIEVSASGGDGNYQYIINGGTPVTTSVFNGLPAGSYTIEVQDGSGVCNDQLTVNLVNNSGPAITAVSSTNISCFGEGDGTITVTANGTAPLTYAYSAGTSVIATNATGTFSNVSPGSYTVIVSDAANCLSTQTVLITEPAALTLTYATTPETCENACDGTANWQVQGGIAPLIQTFNGAPSNGTGENSLCAGNYPLMITDANGCIASQAIAINSGSQIDIGTISVTQDGCSEVCSGSIVATTPDATSYSLNGMTNTTGVFPDLCAGIYQLTVLNNSGCTSSTTVTIYSEASPTADFGFNPINPTVFDTDIDFINYSGGASTYYWEISDLSTGYFYSTSDPHFDLTLPSDTAHYTVCLIAYSDAGCSDTLCKELVVLDDIMIYVPNTFTPDGDEFNQSLFIYTNGIDRFNFEFQLFNRWGELIFETKDPSVGWDGTYNGSLVQSGTYTWKMAVKATHIDYRKTLTGHVNVLR